MPLRVLQALLVASGQPRTYHLILFSYLNLGLFLSVFYKGIYLESKLSDLLYPTILTFSNKRLFKRQRKFPLTGSLSKSMQQPAK